MSGHGHGDFVFIWFFVLLWFVDILFCQPHCANDGERPFAQGLSPRNIYTKIHRNIFEDGPDLDGSINNVKMDDMSG